MTLRRMHMNLNAGFLYLNWWKTAGGGSGPHYRKSGIDYVGSAVWDNNLLDANGDFLNPVPAGTEYMFRWIASNLGSGTGAAIQKAAGFDYTGEQFRVKWDGVGTCEIGLLPGGSVIDTSVPNQVTYTLGTNPGTMQIKFIPTDANNPPRNIRVYQTRYETNINSGEIFNPDVIALCQSFGILRTMNLQGANNTAICNLTDFAQLTPESSMAWGSPYSQSAATNGEFGNKGLVHPGILCKLAQATGCKLHVIIPIKASDDFVTQFATYMRDNCSTVVEYELDNELWNAGYNGAYNYVRSQGVAIWGSGDDDRGAKWVGYRLAQIGKIVGDIYGHRSNNKTRTTGRWLGIAATWNANSSFTAAIIAGVNYWRANVLSPANSLAVNDVIGSVHCTSYLNKAVGSVFGPGNAYGPTAVSKANPAVVTFNGHGFATGKILKWFVATGMTQLHNARTAITVLDANTFTIPVDTTGYSTWVAPGSFPNYNFICDSKLWDMMDQSSTNHDNDGVTYPTKYTWFCQQLRDAGLTGTSSSGYTDPENLGTMVNTYWPAQKVIADANGLQLRQYEGGVTQYVGDDNIVHNGAQFTEYMLAYGVSAEHATLCKEVTKAFIRMGGLYPSRYNLQGPQGEFGVWPCYRFPPLTANGNVGDVANPVFQALKDVSENAQPDTWSIRFN